MAEKQVQRTAVSSLTLGALLMSFLSSEQGYHKDRSERPVLENVHILPHEIYDGPNGNSTPALVFLHGWPDDVAMFRPFAKHLSSKYKCVNCNLPGYPIPRSFQGNRGNMPERIWGFGFDEAALALKNTIIEACQGASTVTLIVHDWGSVCGYLMHESNPDIVQRIVGMDVGWRMDGMTIPGAAGVGIYQAFLNMFYLLPTGVGSLFTNFEATLLGRQGELGAGPVSNEMNWPYRSAWRDMITRGPITRMNHYVPKNLPFLFLYGERLPRFIRFSDEKWGEHIKSTCPGVSRVQSFDGAHWFLREKPQQVLETMEKWLAESEPHMPARKPVQISSGAKL